MKNWRTSAIIASFLGAIFPSLSATPTKAAVLPPATSQQMELLKRWSSIREGISGAQPLVQLNPNLKDVVLSAPLDAGLQNHVRHSYALAQPEEIESLDEFWLELLVAHGDSTLISVFLSTRSQISTSAPLDGDAYLEHWLWKVMGGGNCDGGCDDGGNAGNGQGCGNGDGNNGNGDGSNGGGGNGNGGGKK